MERFYCRERLLVKAQRMPVKVGIVAFPTMNDEFDGVSFHTLESLTIGLRYILF